MNRDILESIVRKAAESSGIQLDNDEISQMVDRTEQRLNKELTGYGKIDRPYEQFYSPDALVDNFEYERLGSFAIKQCLKNGDKVAYECGKKVTFNEMADNIMKCASALRDQGVNSGDIVVMDCLATPETITTFFAINLLGAVVRPIDPISSVETVKKIINESDSKMIITISPKYCELKQLFGVTPLKKMVCLPVSENVFFLKKKDKIKLKFAETLSDSFIKLSGSDKCILWERLMAPYSNFETSINDLQVPFDSNGWAAIFSTSGSTGEPRGVVITNENLLSSVYKQNAAQFDIDSSDTLFNPMPTHSSYFWNDILLAMLYGVTTTLSPVFDAELSSEQIIKSNCSIVLSGPILIDKLCDYVIDKNVKNLKVDLSKIRHLISGGDLLLLDTERKGNSILKSKGSTAVVENALGTSELSGPAMIPNGVMRDKTSYREGSVGLVLPGNVVSIFKYDEDGAERDILEEKYNDGLLYYEIGEICFSCDNPTLFSEYYNNQAATDAVKIMHTDGTWWYHTGDLGYMEPTGHMFCTGRKSGLIVRDGHKIWAKKIEKVVKDIDGVDDCAVIGVPDDRDKEVPACFVSFREDCGVEQKEKVKTVIQSSVMSALDEKHVPKYIDELDTIPRNLMMKVKVGELKKIFDNEHNHSSDNSSTYTKVRSTKNSNI